MRVIETGVNVTYGHSPAAALDRLCLERVDLRHVPLQPGQAVAARGDVRSDCCGRNGPSLVVVEPGRETGCGRRPVDAGRPSHVGGKVAAVGAGNRHADLLVVVDELTARAADRCGGVSGGRAVLIRDEVGLHRAGRRGVDR